jgi:pimeloyl-ACP methyl ester carboxylesterase
MLNKDIIHFSHANGFPATTYKTFFESLGKHYDIGFIDRLGHDEAYPVTENWKHLPTELINYIEANYDRPIIGLGHSLGGVVTYMAALQRPDLFKSILLLDAPVMSGIDSMVIRLSKILGFVDKITPAGRTLGRREVWPDRNTALEYFTNKGLFKNFDPRCLKDYINFGTQPCDEGIKLRFDPATEIDIFRTLPHNVNSANKPLAMPAGLLWGADGSVLKDFQIAKMKYTYGFKTRGVVGSHMFPQERPEGAVEDILSMLQRMMGPYER